jgi:hypothetical protein
MEDPDGTLKAVILSFVLEAVFLIPFFLMNTKKIKRFRKSA